MGYKREKKIYNLVFSDPEMNGLEVKTESASLGAYLKIVELAMRMQSSGAEDLDLAALDELFGRFASVLVSWNLEVEAVVNGEPVDQPVPATKDGLLDQDPDFVMAIINAWTSAVGDVGDGLGKGSTNGAKFPEVSIPMELLSKSPGS
jgi:hypothetical protein